MLYGTLIVYKRIWLKLNSSEPRHRLCLPGHQGRCENGRTFNSHTLWILDSTASRSVWIDVRYHARHCGTPQRSRPSVFYCLCWWNRNTSLVAVHDGGFRYTQKLLEWAFSFQNLRPSLVSYIDIENFLRNGQLGWIVWGGLMIDYLLNSLCQ